MFDLESDLFLWRGEAFIYKYLLSSYYVPGTILSDGDKQLTKQSPLHLHAHILVGLLLMSRVQNIVSFF